MTIDHPYPQHHFLHPHHHADHAEEYSGERAPPAVPPPLPPFSFAAMTSEPPPAVTIDPLVFVHNDLMEATQSWLAHETEDFVAMFHPAPPGQVAMEATHEPPIKPEAERSPLHMNEELGGEDHEAGSTAPTISLRRSARIAATPRRVMVDESVATVGRRSSTVALSSGDDDDDDGSDDDDDDRWDRHRRRGHRGARQPTEDDDQDEVGDSEIAKKERRRQQVRKASRRRRAKLKEEAVFLTTRLKELEEDMRTLRVHFPQLTR